MGSFPIGYPRADPGRVAKPHVIHSIIEWVAQDEINHETIFKVFNIRPNAGNRGSSGLVASASRRNLLWYYVKIYFGISLNYPDITSNTNRTREHLPYWSGLWQRLMLG